MTSASPRFLIVTGDDLGTSSTVNQAIIEAHQRGILTSASLMVTGEAFEEAVALAHRHPSLAVGLHLVLSSGRSVLSHFQIPHLVNREGRFSSQPVWAGLRYQLNPLVHRELRAEIRSQLEKFRQTGLKLSHVDGHQNMHLPPVVLRILLELAEDFGIRVIRLPSEELGITLALDPRGWLEKVALAWTLDGVRLLYAKRLLTVAGIAFTDRVYGLLQNGRMSEEYLLGLISKIRAHRIEIYAHLSTEEHPIASGQDGCATRAQLDAFLSTQVREALLSRGFRLSNYQEAFSPCINSLPLSS